MGDGQDTTNKKVDVRVVMAGEDGEAIRLLAQTINVHASSVIKGLTHFALTLMKKQGLLPAPPQADTDEQD